MLLGLKCINFIEYRACFGVDKFSYRGVDGVFQTRYMGVNCAVVDGGV